MSETPDLESTADRVVAALRNIDGKVNAKRDQRLNDPDSFGDKIFKFAMPTLVGLAFGKVFEMAWKQSVGRKATLPGRHPRHRLRRHFRSLGRTGLATVRPRFQGHRQPSPRQAQVARSSPIVRLALREDDLVYEEVDHHGHASGDERDQQIVYGWIEPCLRQRQPQAVDGVAEQ